MFRFKQFSVADDKSTMKVGTDAVLLGSWVHIGEAKSILDIGTGCGVIALMLAQRSDAMIDAVDIDRDSVEQAQENFNVSPWKTRLHAHELAVQKLTGKFDLIVSNPPFFSKSLLPPKATRQSARHTETLSFDDLLNASRLLSEGGRLAVVLPVVEGDLFRRKAESLGLSCVRSLAFYSRKGKPQERWLMEFSFTRNPEIQTETLVLYEEGERWTEEYRVLTSGFYL